MFYVGNVKLQLVTACSLKMKPCDASQATVSLITSLYSQPKVCVRNNFQNLHSHPMLQGFTEIHIMVQLFLSVVKVR